MNQPAPYPHCIINVDDQSIYTPQLSIVLPLFRPIFFMKMQKGQGGVPVWCESMADAQKFGGSETFNEKSKYFSYAAYFVKKNFEWNGKAWLVRLIDDQYQNACVVYEATTEPVDDIPQYWPVSEEDRTVRTVLDSKQLEVQVFDFVGRDTSKTLELYPVHDIVDGRPCFYNPRNELVKYVFVGDNIGTEEEPELVKRADADVSADAVFVVTEDSITPKMIDDFGRVVPVEGVAAVKKSTMFSFTVDTEGAPVGEAVMPGTMPEDAASSAFKLETRLTKPGLKIEWNLRTMSGVYNEQTHTWSGEIASDPSKLKVKENGNKKTYPIMALVANSPGEWGKNTGFQLYYDPDQNESEKVERVNSVFYSFAGIEKSADNTSTTNLRNAYGNIATVFSPKKDAYDSAYAQDLGMDKVFNASFPAGSQYELPYSVSLYSENIEDIARDIIAKDPSVVGLKAPVVSQEITEEEKADLMAKADAYSQSAAPPEEISSQGTDGIAVWRETQKNNKYAELLTGLEAYKKEQQLEATAKFDEEIEELAPWFKVNIVSGTDLNGVPYNSVEIASTDWDLDGDEVGDGAPVKGVTKYLQRLGDRTVSLDGHTDEDSMQRYLREYLADPEGTHLIDNARYPFTHTIDVGYNLDTKVALLRFIGVREDTKTILSSWIGNVEKAEAGIMQTEESVGAFLTETALMMKESVAMGTDCCRATIMMQAGIPLDYDRYVPETLWLLQAKALYQSGTFLDQDPKGYPNSLNKLFKIHNWIPDTAFLQSRFFQGGYNYCQYYDMYQFFYAAVRSIYPHITSVLVNDTFTDLVVYAKQLCWRVWAKNSGRDDAHEVIADALKSDTELLLREMVNGKAKIEVLVYQTEEEQKLGYVNHIQVTITYGAMQYVNIFDIAVKRENFEG